MDAAFLEGTQNFSLGGQGHVPDFVKEQRASLGLLEVALAVGIGASKGSPHVAEQLALREGFGNRRGVHRHEGTGAAVAQVVNFPGDELLAGAGFAANQHIHRRPSDAFHQPVQVAHGPAHADQRAKASFSARADFAGHGRGTQVPTGGHNAAPAPEFLDLVRLGEVIGRSELHALDGRVDRVVCGYHHDFRVGLSRQFA